MSARREAGSGAAAVMAAVGVEGEMTVPKVLRTSERSVRSMAEPPSKLPSVQREVVLPKWLRMVEKSERSTWPSWLASPGMVSVKERVSAAASTVKKP